MTAEVLDRTAVAIASEPAILARITDADIHLALWRRPRPESMAWVDALRWDVIADLDFQIAVNHLDDEVRDALAEAGYPHDERGSALRAEIVSLGRRFAGIMGCEMLTIRLEIIDSDACRKFHADVVAARLLTTLSGPGTDWIETVAPERIHRSGTGDVAIFKGRLWASEPRILHRSPPLGGSGATRLLLVIEPYVQGPSEGARCG